MKKIVLGLLLFLVFPVISFAQEVDYDITDFYVQSQILENGDLQVNELIVLDGTFNGYERDILYTNDSLEEGNSFANNSLYNASDITEVKIYAKYVTDVSFDTFSDSDFTRFMNVPSANLGDSAKYILSNLNNGYRYRMYYPANNQKVAFYLSYVVKKAVVYHQDVAELYWTFIPDGFEDELNNIQIKVYLPKADTSDNFRVWAHGNLSGEVSKIDNSGVYASIDEVFMGEAVDIRVTFDKNLITDTSDIKTSNQEALASIIEVEEERALVANNLREELLKKYNFVKYSTIIMYIVMIGLGIFIYFKYGKSPKSGYYSKYNREFIDDYNVEVIDYLMNKKITPNAMSASIMNLIYKKNISANEIASDKKTKDYEFTLENMDNINESEQILIEFLFDKVGKNKENTENKKIFTTKDLKSYANGTKTCNTFISSYTKWKNNILNLGKEEKFYEKSFIPGVLGFIVLILCGIIMINAMNYGVDFMPSYFIIVVAIIFFIYTLMVDKKTIKGAEHYDKWKAFKNFLNDFGTFELKELPEIVLWERYLVYATIFGLADKVQKSMNVRIKELDVSVMDDYYPSFVYINMGSTIHSSINSAINSAYSRQAANYANSHSSSSSGGGFGGGFSSGGGFGGGGGGGRGF